MKRLDKEFTKYGYTFKEYKRQKHTAIYEQYLNDRLVAYEVIVVQSARKDFDGRGIKKGDESYPTTAQWGVNGFTYAIYGDRSKALNKAIKKLNFLECKIKRKKI